MKEVVKTEHAPAALGPYSQGIKANGFLFTAGQTGIDPTSGKLIEGSVEAQTEQVLKNIGGILEAAGCGYTDVVKTLVFLKDMGDFAAMNGVYKSFFTEGSFPARTTVAAAGLPLGALVEIECVAVLPTKE